LIVEESPPCASIQPRTPRVKTSPIADTPTVLPLRSAPVLIGLSVFTRSPTRGGAVTSYSPAGASQTSGTPRACATHNVVMPDLPASNEPPRTPAAIAAPFVARDSVASMS